MSEAPEGDEPTPAEALGCLFVAGLVGALLGLVGDLLALVASIRRWWA